MNAMCATSVLEMQDVHVRFGGVHAIAGLSFAVNRGEVLSVIGPNGAGKTSVFNCISGHRRPVAGCIVFEGRDITAIPAMRRAAMGIGRTFQNLALFGQMSVLENVLVGRHHLMRSNVVTGALYWLGGARREEIEHRAAAEEIMQFLDIQHMRHARAGTLPYGLRKRVELARAVALRPSVMLLDEPMAGMNQDEKRAMARHIVQLNRAWGMTILMIEHDTSVVSEISDRVLVLEAGHRIAFAAPETVLADPRVHDAYLGPMAMQPAEI
jgi:branched-chain amino acid transport system ATP-binding protein